MKKLSRIKLQSAVMLENSEMKTIFGGSGSSGKWCYIDGEGIGPLSDCSDAYCKKLYGSGAYCK